MSGLVLFLIIFATSFVCCVICVSIWEHKMHKDCKGFIIMSGEELYLSLTKEDIKTFEHARYVTLELKREKFSGFSE